MEGAQGDSRE